MKAFNRYLKKQGFSEGSITSINKNLKSFFNYLKEEQITVDTIDYSELLTYINYCTGRRNDKTTINYKLRTILLQILE
jgi:site-specific recombinase XerD